MAGVALWSIGTLVAPPAAHMSLFALCATRVFVGLGEGLAPSSATNVLARVIPEGERARAVTAVFGGLDVGSALGLTLLWCLAWPLVKPETREPGEVKPAQKAPKAPTNVPWRKFLRSPPVWAVIVAHFCYNWGYYTLLAWLPSYFEMALGLNVEKSSLLTLIPYIAMTFMTPFVGPVADGLAARGWSVTTVRKLSQGIAFAGPALCMLAMSILTPAAPGGGNTILLVAIMSLAFALGAWARAGLYCNHQGLVSKYSIFVDDLFELAILGMLKDYVIVHGNGQEEFQGAMGQSKAIYIAPTRSLVQEKAREWRERFGTSLHLRVEEFTGDVDNGKDALQESDIICITPERFDSMTRRDKHGGMGFFSQVKLVLLDEIHLLSDSRGSCLEAGVVSRLKMAQQNIDVAEWLCVPEEAIFKFGNEMRPVPLQIVVKGYQSSKNDFLFDRYLTGQVYDLVSKFSNGKPVLCFCPSRQGSVNTATSLRRQSTDHQGRSLFVTSSEQQSFLDEQARSIRNSTLRECVRSGLGFHHGALEPGDRAKVEELFSAKMLRVVSTTSTLAVGVNLPAYLVIIKGTKRYRSWSWYENDLLKVSSLSETIESRLHENIAEYLNAEIANRTIRDIPGALDWLKSTFLYIRALKNPTHYHIPAATLASTLEMDKWLRTHVLLSHANKLVKSGMAYTDEEEYTLCPSQSGIIMAEHYMRLSTMSAICKLKSSSSMEDLMWVIANSDELSPTIVRRNEKKVLNAINKSGMLRYTVKDLRKSPAKILDRVQLPSQKNFLLMMHALSSKARKEYTIEYSLKQEGDSIISVGLRIIRCMVRYFGHVANQPKALADALLLQKVLNQRMWPDDPMLLTQVQTIGDIIANRLIASNVRTMRQMIGTDPRELENFAQKNYPWGSNVRNLVLRICPPPISIQIVLEPNPSQESKLSCNVQISCTDECNDAQKSLSRNCSLVIFTQNGSAMLCYRNLQYSAFSKGGLSVQIDQELIQNPQDRIIVKVIDGAIVGSDVTASTDITPSKTISDHLNHPTPTSPSSVQPKQQQKKKQKMASDAPPSTPVDALQMHKIVDLTTTPLNQIAAPKQEEKRLAAREHVEEFKKKYSNLVKFLMDEEDEH
eukprot:jgi/Picre1/27188/NNA_000157.t1